MSLSRPCHTHSDVPAVRECRGCARPLCDECSVYQSPDRSDFCAPCGLARRDWPSAVLCAMVVVYLVGLAAVSFSGRPSPLALGLVTIAAIAVSRIAFGFAIRFVPSPREGPREARGQASRRAAS